MARASGEPKAATRSQKPATISVSAPAREPRLGDPGRNLGNLCFRHESDHSASRGYGQRGGVYVVGGLSSRAEPRVALCV